ncbi:MAG: hypothetical protein LJE70_01680 [Chromatiaceae bacterium]|nr:hypothetical protein [Chromatiaceae bacterium]
MAGEPREWLDIDSAWLQEYLRKHKIAATFDLDDELIGSQLSWMLSADEWNKLRDAWQKRQVTDEPENEAVIEQAAEAQPRASETGPDSLESAGTDAEIRAAEGASAATPLTIESIEDPEDAITEHSRQLADKQRMDELRRSALGDWDAFKELFRDCPESVDFPSWETLAESPVALLKQAENLIRSQDADARGSKHQTQQELEDEVARAQNIIAGYFIYCRKHRLGPSLEHLRDFIPEIATAHSPAAVMEAWKREAE